jgi:hypothetical protein
MIRADPGLALHLRGDPDHPFFHPWEVLGQERTGEQNRQEKQNQQEEEANPQPRRIEEKRDPFLS